MGKMIGDGEGEGERERGRKREREGGREGGRTLVLPLCFLEEDSKPYQVMF